MKHEGDMTQQHDPNQPESDLESTQVHETYDPPVEGTNGHPAPTVQVERPVGRAGARRWGIALVVVALVVGVAAGAVFLLGGGSSPSAVLAYVPKDAITYVDARLDLPGDQRQKVGELLSRFPGFADQSTLEAKLDEVLDRIIGEATSGEQAFSSDIKPWFGGEIGVAIGRLPDPPADGATEVDSGSMLALISIKDEAGARAWFADVVGDESTTSETYAGTELVVVGPDGAGVMAIVDGGVMLLGDEVTVKAAVDGGGAGGLETNEQFRTARAATTGDHLASFYVDTAAYAAWLERAGSAMGESILGLGFPGIGADAVPAWTAGQLRSDGDALVVDLVTPHVAGAEARTNRISTIAGRVPANTLAVVDIHDAGTSLADLIESVRADPETADAFAEIESAVALLGGFDGLIGWIGDAGIVVGVNGGDVGGGLVVSATDPAAAERVTSTLRGVLALAGGQMGVETRDEDYNGTTITFLDLSAAIDATGSVGSDVPEIGWAVAGDVVVIGVGDAFIRSVIDTTPDTSLASTDRYEQLVGRVGREHFTSFWLDVVGLRDLVETMGAEAPDGMADYEANVKPYLEPFDAIVGAAVAGAELDRTTIILSVK